jgi:hypothetical protein
VEVDTSPTGKLQKLRSKNLAERHDDYDVGIQPLETTQELQIGDSPGLRRR